MRWRLQVLAAICVASLALLWAGCAGNSAPVTTATATSTSPATSTTTLPPAAAGDWPTYHHDAAGSGVSSDQLPLGRVRQGWVLAPLDGAPYAEPLVLGSRVFVANGNRIAAFSGG